MTSYDFLFRAYLGIFPSGPRGFSLIFLSEFRGFCDSFRRSPLNCPGLFVPFLSEHPGTFPVVPRKINAGVFFSGIPSRVPPRISQIIFLYFFRPYSQDLSRAHLGIFAIVFFSDIFHGVPPEVSDSVFF